jgi:hypothetical protein
MTAEQNVDPGTAEEEKWCAERREQVEQYLRDQKLTHGQIGKAPAWFVGPLISVWAVESLKSPGWVGWWVVCGDLPTDYCSADNCRHPRLALERIADRWRDAIAATLPNDTEIGSTGLAVDLKPLLAARVDLLTTICADDAAWTAIES